MHVMEKEMEGKKLVEGIEATSDLGVRRALATFMPFLQSIAHQCKMWDASVLSGCDFHISYSSCS